MVYVGLIEANSHTLKRIEDNDEAALEGMLTTRDETSGQRRYARLGCVVCRIVNRSHGDGDGDGDCIILWNPYARVYWAAMAIGRRHITAQ